VSRGRGRIPAWLASGFDRMGGTATLRAVGDRFSIAPNGFTPRLRARRGRPFQILIYHRIHDRPREFMLDTVAVDRFDEQMRHLGRRYRVLPLSELLDRAGQGEIPPRAIAVTFDDGYRDNFTHAYPVLRRYGLPASIFVVTGSIGTGRILWHDQALFAFEQTRKDRYPDPDRGDPTDIRPIAAREGTAHKVLARLKRMSGEERERALTSLFEVLEVDRSRLPSNLMLSWDETEAMTQGRIEIGSHTVTHPILSLETPERVAAELQESKRTIERELGRETRLFAYPNGTRADYTADVREAVRAAGYRCALTTRFGPNEPGDDPFEWRRGTPWEEHRALFSVKLALYRAMEANS